MTIIEHRHPQLSDRVVSRPDGLEITGDLPINEWRRIGEALLAATDRALWSLGDWRLYGERYARDYHEVVVEFDTRSRMVRHAARVARGIPVERRRPGLSWEMHELVASLDEPEQERWLDEAERHGWTRQQLQFAFSEDLERARPPALSVRAIGELHDLCVRAAEIEGRDPRDWALGVLERAAREVVGRAMVQEAA